MKEADALQSDSSPPAESAPAPAPAEAAPTPSPAAAPASEVFAWRIPKEAERELELTIRAVELGAQVFPEYDDRAERAFPEAASEEEARALAVKAEELLVESVPRPPTTGMEGRARKHKPAREMWGRIDQYTEAAAKMGGAGPWMRVAREIASRIPAEMVNVEFSAAGRKGALTIEGMSSSTISFGGLGAVQRSLDSLDIKWDGTLELQRIKFKTRAEQLAWLRAPTFEPPARDSDKAAQTPGDYYPASYEMKKKPEYLARLPVRPPLPLASFGNVADALGPSLGRDMANERLGIVTKGIVFTEKGDAYVVGGGDANPFSLRYTAMVASRARDANAESAARSWADVETEDGEAEQLRLAVYDIETGNPGATVPQYGYGLGEEGPRDEFASEDVALDFPYPDFLFPAKMHAGAEWKHPAEAGFFESTVTASGFGRPGEKRRRGRRGVNDTFSGIALTPITFAADDADGEDERQVYYIMRSDYARAWHLHNAVGRGGESFAAVVTEGHYSNRPHLVFWGPGWMFTARAWEGGTLAREGQAAENPAADFGAGASMRPGFFPFPSTQSAEFVEKRGSGQPTPTPSPAGTAPAPAASEEPAPAPNAGEALLEEYKQMESAARASIQGAKTAVKTGDKKAPPKKKKDDDDEPKVKTLTRLERMKLARERAAALGVQIPVSRAEEILKMAAGQPLRQLFRGGDRVRRLAALVVDGPGRKPDIPPFPVTKEISTAMTMAESDRIADEDIEAIEKVFGGRENVPKPLRDRFDGDGEPIAVLSVLDATQPIFEGQERDGKFVERDAVLRMLAAEARGEPEMTSLDFQRLTLFSANEMAIEEIKPKLAEKNVDLENVSAVRGALADIFDEERSVKVHGADKSDKITELLAGAEEGEGEAEEDGEDVPDENLAFESEGEEDFVDESAAPRPARNAHGEMLGENTAARRLYDALREAYEKGEKIRTNKDARLIAGTDADKPSDLNNAAEIAKNALLLDLGVAQTLDWKTAARVTDLLPRQEQDSAQMALQSFSTPPAISALAVQAAMITDNDRAVEPSAGTGNLAVFMGVRRTDVNEFMAPRREGLESLGWENMTAANANARGGRILGQTPDESRAELLGKRMPESYDVVVTNPPFSKNEATGEKGVKVMARFAQSAADMVKDGGRLVVISGENWGPDTHGNFFSALLRERGATVAANIWVDGKLYAKQGASFPIRLTVVDFGEAVGDVVEGKAESLQELADLVGQIRARGKSSARAEAEAEVDAESRAAISAAGRGGMLPTPAEREAKVQAKLKDMAEDKGHIVVDGLDEDEGEEEGETAPPKKPAAARPSGDGSGDAPAPRRPQPISSGTPEHSGESRVRKTDADDEPTPAKELSDAELERAKAARANTDDAKVTRVARFANLGHGEHPVALTRTAAMEASRPPPVTAGALQKIADVIGFMKANPKAEYYPSDAQAEMAGRALDAWEKYVLQKRLKSQMKLNAADEGEGVGRKEMSDADRKEAVEFRRALTIGAGAGFGKTLVGVTVMKAARMMGVTAPFLIVTAGEMKTSGKGENPLHSQLRKELSFAGLDEELRGFSGKKNEYAGDNATLFATYGTLSAVEKAGTGRRKPGDMETGEIFTKNLIALDKQLVGDGGSPLDYDGVILVDEFHKAKNVAGKRSEMFGQSEASGIGLMLATLSSRYPNARFVYMSATPFSEPDNLMAAARSLPVGAGEMYGNALDLVNDLRRYGMPLVEWISQGMREDGFADAVDLSFDGVKFESLAIDYDEYQEQIEDAWGRIWGNIREAVYKALIESAKDGLENPDDLKDGMTAKMRQAKNSALGAALLRADNLRAASYIANTVGTVAAEYFVGVVRNKDGSIKTTKDGKPVISKEARRKVNIQTSDIWQPHTERAIVRVESAYWKVGPDGLLEQTTKEEGAQFSRNHSDFPWHMVDMSPTEVILQYLADEFHVSATELVPDNSDRKKMVLQEVGRRYSDQSRTLKEFVRGAKGKWQQAAFYNAKGFEVTPKGEPILTTEDMRAGYTSLEDMMRVIGRKGMDERSGPIEREELIDANLRLLEDGGLEIMRPLGKAHKYRYKAITADPELLAKRAVFEKQVKEELGFGVLRNPLDMVREAFARRQLELTGKWVDFGEISGREMRYDLGEDPTSLPDLENDRMVKATATKQSVLADFRQDRNAGIIFSPAGGTGVDMQAHPNNVNPYPILHIVFTAGDKADEAIQMLGRSHRANQVGPPTYMLPGMNDPVLNFRLARIATKLRMLGAVSKGDQRGANNQVVEMGAVAEMGPIFDEAVRMVAMQMAAGEFQDEFPMDWKLFFINALRMKTKKDEKEKPPEVKDLIADGDQFVRGLGSPSEALPEGWGALRMRRYFMDKVLTIQAGIKREMEERGESIGGAPTVRAPQDGYAVVEGSKRIKGGGVLRVVRVASPPSPLDSHTARTFKVRPDADGNVEPLPRYFWSVRSSMRPVVFAPARKVMAEKNNKGEVSHQERAGYEMRRSGKKLGYGEFVTNQQFQDAIASGRFVEIGDSEDDADYWERKWKEESDNLQWSEEVRYFASGRGARKSYPKIPKPQSDGKSGGGIKHVIPGGRKPNPDTGELEDVVWVDKTTGAVEFFGVEIPARTPEERGALEKYIGEFVVGVPSLASAVAEADDPMEYLVKHGESLSVGKGLGLEARYDRDEKLFRIVGSGPAMRKHAPWLSGIPALKPVRRSGGHQFQTTDADAVRAVLMAKGWGRVKDKASFGVADADADRRRIRLAEKMDGGLSPESIFRHTGLFRDFETREWMRVIPPGKYRWKSAAPKIEAGTATMADVYDAPALYAEFPALKKAAVRFVPWWMIMTNGLISYDKDGAPTIFIKQWEVEAAAKGDEALYNEKAKKAFDRYFEELRDTDGYLTDTWRSAAFRGKVEGDFADIGSRQFLKGTRARREKGLQETLEHEIQHYIDGVEGRSSSASRERLVVFGELAKGADFWKEAADKAELSGDKDNRAGLEKIAERTLAGGFKDEDEVFAALGEIFTEPEMVKLRRAALALAYEKSVGEVRARQAEKWTPGAPPLFPAGAEELIPNFNVARAGEVSESRADDGGHPDAFPVAPAPKGLPIWDNTESNGWIAVDDLPVRFAKGTELHRRLAAAQYFPRKNGRASGGWRPELNEGSELGVAVIEYALAAEPILTREWLARRHGGIHLWKRMAEGARAQRVVSDNPSEMRKLTKRLNELAAQMANGEQWGKISLEKWDSAGAVGRARRDPEGRALIRLFTAGRTPEQIAGTLAHEFIHTNIYPAMSDADRGRVKRLAQKWLADEAIYSGVVASLTDAGAAPEQAAAMATAARDGDYALPETEDAAEEALAYALEKYAVAKEAAREKMTGAGLLQKIWYGIKTMGALVGKWFKGEAAADAVLRTIYLGRGRPEWSRNFGDAPAGASFGSDADMWAEAERRMKEEDAADRRDGVTYAVYEYALGSWGEVARGLTRPAALRKMGKTKTRYVGREASPGKTRMAIYATPDGMKMLREREEQAQRAGPERMRAVFGEQGDIDGVAVVGDERASFGADEQGEFPGLDAAMDADLRALPPEEQAAWREHLRWQEEQDPEDTWSLGSLKERLAAVERRFKKPADRAPIKDVERPVELSLPGKVFTHLHEGLEDDGGIEEKEKADLLKILDAAKWTRRGRGESAAIRLSLREAEMMASEAEAEAMLDEDGKGPNVTREDKWRAEKMKAAHERIMAAIAKAKAGGE